MSESFTDEHHRYLCDLLEQAANPLTHASPNSNNGGMAAITSAIETFCQTLPGPAVIEHLMAAVLAQGGTALLSVPARAIAGILLKNFIIKHPRAPTSKPPITESQCMALIQMLSLLNDSSLTLIGRCVGAFIAVLGAWEASHHQIIAKAPIFLLLLKCLQSEPNPYATMHLLTALKQLIEECSSSLLAYREVESELLPQLLTWLASPTQSSPLASVKSTKILLSCIRSFIPLHVSLITQNLTPLTQCIAILHNRYSEEEEEPSDLEDLNDLQCEVFSWITECYGNDLDVEQPDLITFIYRSVMDSFTVKPLSRQVALAAGQFWLGEVQSEGAVVRLTSLENQPIIEALVPILLHRMRYDEEDDEDELCLALEDLSVPDDEKDLKPRHLRQNAAASASETTALWSQDESDDQEADGQDDNDDAFWSLRKCSAATLDALSLTMNAERLVQIFMPSFYEAAQQPAWFDREAAVLAFGAVAPGMWKALAPHLPQIVPFLCSLLLTENESPLVKTMAAWCLGRLAEWIVLDTSCEMSERVIEALLLALANRNKRLQHSATSAFIALLDASSPDSGHCLKKQTPALLAAICVAIRCYRTRAMMALLELIRKIVDKWDGESVEAEQERAYLRSTLIHVFNMFGPESINNSLIFPVTESLIAALNNPATARLLADVAQDLTNRAVALAVHNIEALDAASESLEEGLIREDDGSGALDDGQDDFLVAALDLLDALVSANMASSISSKSDQLGRILNWSLLYASSVSNHVRQSAFALLGDLCKFGLMRQALIESHSAMAVFATIQQVTAECLQPSDSCPLPVSINAIWSLGELATCHVRYVEFQQLFLPKLLDILNRNNMRPGQQCYYENIAVTVGRILLIDVNIGGLPIPFEKALALLETVDSWEEKLSALAGYISTPAAKAGMQQLRPAVTSVLATIENLHDDPRIAASPFSAALVSWLH